MYAVGWPDNQLKCLFFLFFFQMSFLSILYFAILLCFLEPFPKPLMYILRFILPCKSDCQPIFLKKQGTYSLYAKLWLVRPLIKNIPDSFHQYLSNVTFKASLSFQMREEYVFEKNYFWKLDLMGVNSGSTQFHTQFTHVSSFE